MANKTQTIRIESILGGHSNATHFSASDQFLSSVGVDPSLGITDTSDSFRSVPCGLIRPSPVREFSQGSVTGVPLWITGTPRRTDLYIYDASGSVYTLPSTFTSISGIGDLTDGGSASGNGAAYYDNYVYFARDTTIARYGPLDGTPAFTDDYWVSTLAKTALSNKIYPRIPGETTTYPNHILHRHSDGKLYILDVLDNRGTIHYIQTTKTTVEGDTDAGSTYNKLQVGYGLYPTAIESYGSNLVIAFAEMEDSHPTSNFGSTRTNAKIAFWDTTAPVVNSITWAEYPDQFVSAIRNLNGVLYFISGSNTFEDGFRILRYIGGSSFEQVHFSTSGYPAPSGAVDAIGGRIYLAANINTPLTEGAAVLAYGTGYANVGNGLYYVMGSSYSTSLTSPTALALDVSGALNRTLPIVGWVNSNTYGIDIPFGYGNHRSEWFSQIYKIGQPFKITKIRIPLGQVLTANMDVDVDIYVDGIPGNGISNSTDLVNINSTNFGTNTKTIVIRPENLTGNNDLTLGLAWTGTTLCVVSLPIVIEYELLDVETTRP